MAAGSQNSCHETHEIHERGNRLSCFSCVSWLIFFSWEALFPLRAWTLSAGRLLRIRIPQLSWDRAFRLPGSSIGGKVRRTVPAQQQDLQRVLLRPVIPGKTGRATRTRQRPARRTARRRLQEYVMPKTSIRLSCRRCKGILSGQTSQKAGSRHRYEPGEQACLLQLPGIARSERWP